MNAQRTTSLWEAIAGAAQPARAAFLAPGQRIVLDALATGSCLAGGPEPFRGRTVLLAADDQLHAALALAELDGVARRIVLCTPDLDAARRAEVAAAAEIDAVVSEAPEMLAAVGAQVRARITARPVTAPVERRCSAASEWILLTSGTTGSPKLVVHTLESLAGTLPRGAAAPSAVWSTFYDIRRYGGLQIYLRAVLGGVPLVLSSSNESTAQFLARAGAAGVTHISGTPSHWRRVLMSGQAARLDPAYVRLSGEVADQTILDQLHAAYPKARIAHAFASTEAGVAFDVDDGRAGFPAAMIDSPRAGIVMRIVDGTLRIRSERTAARYLGSAQAPLADADGFVDTGDLVELQDGRYYFRGRRGGIINVGGLKVYPEEVEAVLNADPRVRMSLVRARRNPITGAVVVADVVAAANDAAAADESAAETLKSELLDRCRQALPAHKVPATLRLVPRLEVTAAGKLVRPGA